MNDHKFPFKYKDLNCFHLAFHPGLQPSGHRQNIVNSVYTTVMHETISLLLNSKHSKYKKGFLLYLFIYPDYRTLRKVSPGVECFTVLNSNDLAVF